MFLEALLILKWLPKITIFYVLFSMIMGLEINNIVVVITLLLDLVDYIPIE